MVSRAVMVCLLGAGIGAAQQTTGVKPGSKSPAGSDQSKSVAAVKTASPEGKADIASDQPVITLHGLCDNKTSSSAPCETKVTREQFDALLQAFNPGHQNITPAMRRNLAQAYV